jgi:hypothetical protein
MRSIDYGWMVMLGIVVVIAIFWKAIFGFFGGVNDKMNNKDKLEAGKKVFYDTGRWGEGTYKSCAMCHAADFVPDPSKKIEMTEYKPGAPIILKDIKRKYPAGNMGTDEEILEQINKCVASPLRLGSATFSRQLPWMDDLIFYVSRQ